MSRTHRVLMGLAAVFLAACGGPQATATTGPGPSATAPVAAASTSTPAPLTARLGEIVNVVEGRAAATDPYAALSLGFLLPVGGTVRTHDSSSARLDLSDGSIVRLAADTSFALTQLTQSDGNLVTRIQLELGKVWVSLAGGSLEVDTPVGVAAVRGSYAGFAYDPVTGTLYIQCLEGSCDAHNEQGEIQLGNFQGTSLTDKGPGQVIILTGQELDEFMRNNPEVGNSIVATLTAAPPATATNTPHPGQGGARYLNIGLLSPRVVFITFDVLGPTDGDFHGQAEGRNYDCAILPDIPGRLYCTGPMLVQGQRVQFELFGGTGLIFTGPIVMPNIPTPTFTPFPTDTPVPTATVYGGAALESSPLYVALERQQTSSAPIGAASGLLTVVGLVGAGWVYRRRGRRQSSGK